MRYSLFDPKVDKPLHLLTRSEAKAAYDWFVSQKEVRKQALLSYAEGLGIDLQCDNKDSLERLHGLLVEDIQREGHQTVPSPHAYSLCNDIAMHMADLLIENAPHLSWAMHTAGRTDLLYQRPVIRGFNVSNKNYCVDFDYVLCQYAHRLCRGGGKEEGFLWQLYSSALAKA